MLDPCVAAGLAVLLAIVLAKKVDVASSLLDLMMWLVGKGGTSRVLPAEEGETVISLLPMETELLLRLASISTVTFLKGDAEAAAEALEGRLASALAHNPWLNGRLATRDSKPALVIRESSAPLRIHRLKGAAAVQGLASTDSYAKIAKCLQATGLFVKRGVECQDREAEPLFKVSLVDTELDGEAALVVSLSHAVCDGADFYGIHNMLATGRTAPLDPNRRHESVDETRKLLGAEEVGLVSPPPLWLIVSLFGAFIKGTLFGPPAADRFHYINEEYIAARKAEAAASGQTEYTSLNDTVTSTFFSAVRPNVGVLVVNCRDRITSCNAFTAGNYESILWLRPPDYASPTLIRKALRSPSGEGSGSLKRAAVPRTSLPSKSFVPALWGGDTILGAKWALVTSWCSFTGGLAAQPVALPGCSHELHAPLADLLYPPRMGPACIVFMAKPGKRAVRIYGTPQELDAVAASGMLGERLSLSQS